MSAFDDQLRACLLRDRRRLRSLAARVERGTAGEQGRVELERAIAASRSTVELRRTTLPRPSYPENLPI